MANGICGSDGPATGRADLIADLGVLAKIAWRNLGVSVWFVEIAGKRWSYIAGERVAAPSQDRLMRIPLVADLGMMVDGWQRLDPGQQREVIDFMRRLVGELAGASPPGGTHAAR